MFQLWSAFEMLVVKGKTYKTESIIIREIDVGYIFRIEKQPRLGDEKDWGHAGCILPLGQIVAYGYPPTALLEANSFQGKVEKGLAAKYKVDHELPDQYTVVETAIKCGYESQVIIITTDHIVLQFFKIFGKKNQAPTIKLFAIVLPFVIRLFENLNLFLILSYPLLRREDYIIYC